MMMLRSLSLLLARRVLVRARASTRNKEAEESGGTGVDEGSMPVSQGRSIDGSVDEGKGVKAEREKGVSDPLGAGTSAIDHPAEDSTAGSAGVAASWDSGGPGVGGGGDAVADANGEVEMEEESDDKPLEQVNGW